MDGSRSRRQVAYELKLDEDSATVKDNTRTKSDAKNVRVMIKTLDNFIRQLQNYVIKGDADA